MARIGQQFKSFYNYTAAILKLTCKAASTPLHAASSPPGRVPRLGPEKILRHEWSQRLGDADLPAAPPRDSDRTDDDRGPISLEAS